MKPMSFWLLLFFIPIFATAQDSKLSIFESLQFQEVIDITLETSFQSMIANPANEEYQAATFSYQDADGNKMKWNAQVKQRGKYRRRICEMPPLKLKFAKADLEAKGLKKGYNEMKVVTYCVDDPTSKETVIKEYLIYKMYNELSDQSFRVQLVRINYVDTQDPNKNQNILGF
ncbi:MAG: hypothetical protein HC892_15085 [Saprospiraceae bacterium]|nr:hypothetical protein [Saprospiraceae bacterium]